MSLDKEVVIALVGPTGSGKTAISFDIAREFNCEIIACDSRTVYREMDIGTAKPTKEEQKCIPHYMLDVVNPNEDYTVSLFRDSASVAMQEIFAKGKTPLIVGGGGFYIRALLEGLDMPSVPPQNDLRNKLETKANEEGNIVLHNQLKGLDPISANKINVNDRFRLIRALEVTLTTGQPFSQLTKRSKPKYKIVWMGLNAHERGNLYQSIKTRFQAQIERGLFAEVERLYKKWGACKALTNTINYKEIIDCLDGKISKSEAEELAIKHNCNLAQRQLVWFRSNKDINWLLIDQLSQKELKEKARDIIRSTKI